MKHMRKTCALNCKLIHAHTHACTHNHTLHLQSEGEPPELEELNDEYDIPQDSWDILDKAKPTEEPTSSNPAFITEGFPHPEDNEEGKQASPPLAPCPAHDTSSVCEDVPFVTARNDASDSQDGFFSTRLTDKQSSPHPSSLIMGTSPSPSSNRHPKSVGFKPLIEVVSSNQKSSSEEHSQPFTSPSPTPVQPPQSTMSRGTTKKSFISPPRDGSKLAWSSNKTPAAAPESSELESGGQWAVNASITRPESERFKTKPESRMESGGLLIEEIDDDDDDFNVGHLPLTVDEQAAIAQTDAALQRIRNRPISELNEEERVWQLAASAGSTSLEGGAEGAELDEETKARLRERLSKHGLIDKTSLKF